MNIKKLISSPFLRKGFLFTIFSFANNGISFLLLIILANYISVNEYGQLNLFNTLIVLLSIVISLSTSSFIPVSFFKKSREEFREVISTVLFVSTFLLVTISFVLLLFSNSLEKIIGISIQYQFVALLICYMQIYTTINLELWRIEERPVIYGTYSLSSVVLSFALSLLLVISFHLGWLGRVYAQLTVAAIFFLISIVFILKRGYLTWMMPRKEILKEALSFGLPLVPHHVSFWLRQGLDRIVINYYYTEVEVGIYGFAMNFANIISTVGAAFNATNSVNIYKQLSANPESAKQQLKRQSRLMIIFFFSLTVVVCVSVSLFIPLFLPKYGLSVHLLPFLCLSAFFQCVYLLYVNYLYYYKKTKVLMSITFTSSIIQVLLVLFLTKYGIEWTAIISMVISFCITFAVYLYSRKLQA